MRHSGGNVRSRRGASASKCVENVRVADGASDLGSACDIKNLTRYKAGSLVDKEGDRVRDIFWHSRATDRYFPYARVSSSQEMPSTTAVASVIAVPMNPGAIALAATANLPSSMARVSVIPNSPDLTKAN
jgi:hypothetical protein